jgi:ABC-2 type transport system permease protein
VDLPDPGAGRLHHRDHRGSWCRTTRPPGRAGARPKWLDNAADFWDAPSSGLVRMLVGAFIAVVFAGEYGWNTWKLIVPHRSRTTLIAAKYVVSLGLLYAAFVAAASSGW